MNEHESPLLLSMDIRNSPTEQDMALISFYKRPNVEWGRPLNCKLEGSSNYKFLQFKSILSIYLVFILLTLHYVAGDTAIGEGVTRFFFSTCIEKLRSGFCINFGMYAIASFQMQCLFEAIHTCHHIFNMIFCPCTLKVF